MMDEELPQWLKTLMTKKFSDKCEVHRERLKKNEMNILCLDCCFSFCSYCQHPPHRVLKIRRYMYNDVVDVLDMEKFIDMATIQTYKSNQMNVVLINERIQPRSARNIAASNCRICDRGIQEGSLYCSLHCKVEALLRQEGELSKHLRLRDCEPLPVPNSSEPEEGHLSADSVLDSTTSGSTASVVGGPTETLKTAASGIVVPRGRSSIVSPNAVSDQTNEVAVPNAVSDQPSGSSFQGRSDSSSRRKQRYPQRAPAPTWRAPPPS